VQRAALQRVVALGVVPVAPAVDAQVPAVVAQAAPLKVVQAAL
jgi:hypothetical protein